MDTYEAEDRKKIMQKYRGLREEDLPEGNCYYACITCGKNDCELVGKEKGACPDHIDVSEEEFALRYDFVKGGK